jgi:hypothetical protein
MPWNCWFSGNTQAVCLATGGPEVKVHFNQASLRFVVEKWFGKDSLSSLRVNRVWHARLGRNHCVRVRLSRPDNPVIIFFFRHDDGNWNVFPPEAKRATLTITEFCVQRPF